jgi:hypothetical protein
MKKSKKTWILIIFFVWATLKSAGSIYGYETVSDYGVLSAIGLFWLYFLLNIPVMLLEATTAFLLISRNTYAFISGVSLCVLASINGIIVTTISVFNLETVKSFYIASREARGMTAREDAMGFLFTSQGLIVMCLVYIIFYILIAYGLFKVKNEMKEEIA